MSVALLPASRLKIIAKPAKLVVVAVDRSQRGNAGTDSSIQICMGPAPIRTEKSVGAVSGNREPLYVQDAEFRAQLHKRGESRPVFLEHLGEISLRCVE